MIAHVSDFGLARILAITNEVSQNQTSTTGVKGSIGYTAPEYGMGGEASTQGIRGASPNTMQFTGMQPSGN
ncbi:hypothetical protein CMV_005596 [Castanea mollissima]|uniref:Protein kinase domain-containing protein n=1 Tax=Castanea mollissima TaxID=60419 RepID=A0A8J4W469_9ROSI|nr:hypothetical protein CMV_005596 [Castanea mollissima]